ncbi:alpha-L-arabinofuranosidase C-terminal domain-containing protein [Terriglobus sp.]|uniref:alpha-L-arabinofuranosidase C-terminal domain-containing protein n=1 Tax=Terriglobus sp. TaxID=1889013 RepID=UPI003B008FAC
MTASVRHTAALLVLATPFVLRAQTPGTATVQVDATHVENRVSPRMYSAFTEMMAEDVKRGLTAEMLLDRSFEQPVDYLNLPAHWQQEPDERNDVAGAFHFAQTTDAAYPVTDAATHQPNHSLRVNLSPADITDTRRGFSQGTLSVVAGQAYRGYIWAKVPPDKGYTGNVRVALEENNTDGATYASTTLTGVAGDWRKYDFTLTPSQTDRFAKLSFLFDGHGTLFIDEASLEPASARGEVRADTEAMIAGLHPSFQRWPGGNVAQDYHWQWGIGPRDQRAVFVNKSWSNAPEPNDFGTDEYLAYCERLHIEPTITVNVDGAGATPEEAAHWVEYVNGPASSKYGAMRAANGHPAPYGVKQWELGNEIFGDWVRGHVTAEQYAEAAVRYAKAMRAVDPSLRLVAVGEGIFPGSDAWNSAVLRIAGPQIQYLAVHDYTTLAENSKAPDPRNAMMARAGAYERNYRHMGDLLQQNAPGRDIKLIVNEWNLFYGADVIQSMEGAVYASRMMNGFERDGAVVEANSISDLLNGWPGGIIQASRDRVYGTAQYYAVKLYNDNLAADRLRAEVQSPELGAGLSAVDAVAGHSADGKRLFVKLSNADAAHSIRTTLRVTGFEHGPNATVQLLSAADPHQRNSFSHPIAVAPVTRPLHCSAACAVTLPPDSIAVVTLTASGR